MIDIAPLREILPSQVYAQLGGVASVFQLTNIRRMAHFLSQCSHESQGFTRTEENLNYSAERLLQIFPKYFRDKDPAAYARNPERIANLVYGNRLGNGDEASGDGFRFRGRGYIQLTGKQNYELFDDYVSEDIVENPGLVATQYPLLSAGFYWHWRTMNNLADKECVECITKAVNGGTNGLEERKKLYDRFTIALS